MISDLTQQLNKVFHDRVRLAVMSTLVASEDEKSFSELVDLLNVTRGNLSVHAKVLEKHGYIQIKKAFVDNKPKTTFKATTAGRQAFEQYITLLEQIIKGIQS